MSHELEETAPAELPVGLLALGLDNSGEQREVERSVEAFRKHSSGISLGSKLGQGGMGVVFRGRQDRLDRDVAIKLLRPELGEAFEFAERFEREARALAKLDHPGIVRIYDVGEADLAPYIVMEFVDGTSLRERLRTGTPPTTAEALELIVQLCAAVGYCHKACVVHRDLKPENLLLTSSGVLKVADFGLVKLQMEGATGTGAVMGTANYMAPEQRNDPTAVNQRCDVFSIGVIAYELLTGRLPAGVFAPPSNLSDAPQPLDAVVLRALAADPAARYADANELGDAFAAAMRPLAPPASPPTRQRPRWVLPLVGAAIVGALALLGLSWRGSDTPASAPPRPATVVPAAAAATPTPTAAEQWATDGWPSADFPSLPPDAHLVIGIDWSEIRHTPFVRQISSKSLPDYNPSEQACWNFLSNDVTKVVVGAVSGDDITLVAHGTWQPGEVRQCLNMLGAPESPAPDDGEPDARSGLPNHQEWRLNGSDGSRMPLTLVHDDERLLALIGVRVDDDVLAKRWNGDTVQTALRRDVLARVQGDATVWAVARPSASFHLPLSMTEAACSISVWQAVQLHARADFASESEANTAVGSAKTLSQLLGASTLGVTSSLEIRAEAKTLLIDGSIAVDAKTLGAAQISIESVPTSNRDTFTFGIAPEDTP